MHFSYISNRALITVQFITAIASGDYYNVETSSLWNISSPVTSATTGPHSSAPYSDTHKKAIPVTGLGGL
jgi:hypothetical protein